MVKSSETFLIDSSALIAPYRLYYAFDIAPSFWKYLKECFESGKIVLLDKVLSELKKGGEEDDLSRWVKENEDLFTILTFKTESIITNYSVVLRYLQTSGLYYESAIAEWAIESIADPWIIAAARANDYTIVTEEKGSNGISISNKNKRPKIPDVAKALGVESISLFEMMRKLEIRM